MVANHDSPAPVPARFYHAISLYFGMPVALGLAFGVTQAGVIAPLMHKPVSIVYWISLLVALWLLMEACSRLASRLLRPIDPPLWMILVAGGLIQTPLGSLYLAGQQQFFTHFLTAPAFQSPFVFDGIPSFAASLPRLLLQNAAPIVIWVLTNYFFDRVVGFPRFRRVPRQSVAATPVSSVEASPAVEMSAPTPPPERAWLVNRLPENVRGDVLVISSMDHYLRVTTDKGSGIVHGRFTDAIAEMPDGQGWQVHRSHWVHRAAIRCVVTHGQRFRIELTNGSVIPASPRYIEVLRRAGFTPQRPQSGTGFDQQANRARNFG